MPRSKIYLQLLKITADAWRLWKKKNIICKYFMISQNTPIPKVGRITFPHLPFYVLKPMGNRKLEIQDIFIVWRNINHAIWQAINWNQTSEFPAWANYCFFFQWKYTIHFAKIELYFSKAKKYKIFLFCFFWGKQTSEEVCYKRFFNSLLAKVLSLEKNSD